MPVALGVLLLVVGLGMLWPAVHKLEAPETVPPVGQAALWVAGVVLATKELLLRYMLGDLVVFDVHLEVEASLTIEAGHDIAVLARRRVLERHRVLNLMTHVDPWRPPAPPTMAVNGRRVASVAK